MIICDGVADRPVPELNNRTPLQVARRPNMNELAKRGISGLMYTIAPGVAPGSDTAHLALLGYDPFKVYTGRGPFEAAGAGIRLKPGDIAFRVNYSTVNDNLIIRDRRAGRIRDTRELEAAIKRVKLPGVHPIFKSTISHRAALVLRGKGLSHKVTNSDHYHEGVKVRRIKPLAREATKTAKLLNEFTNKTHKVLQNHPFNKKREKEGLLPANYLLLRGPGVVPRLPSLKERFDLNGACVAAAALVKGVCCLAGMTIINVPEATGTINTDLDAKRLTAVRALEDHDFVLLHIKGFDEVSHDGDYAAKVRFIERADGLIGQLGDAADYIVLTADHATPVTVREHTGDSVPVAITGPGVRSDEILTYDEYAAADGRLGRIRGNDLLPTLVDLMGKGKKFGA